MDSPRSAKKSGHWTFSQQVACQASTDEIQLWTRITAQVSRSCCFDGCCWHHFIDHLNDTFIDQFKLLINWLFYSLSHVLVLFILVFTILGLSKEVDANGYRTYTRPAGKQGGHGVGWSEIPPYQFKVLCYTLISIQGTFLYCYINSFLWILLKRDIEWE